MSLMKVLFLPYKTDFYFRNCFCYQVENDYFAIDF